MTNREIKFRAWDKINEKVVDVVGISRLSKQDTEDEPEWKHCDEVQEIAVRDIVDHETYEKPNWRPATQFILLQFTSHKDKKGVEIFEGDIVLSNEGTKHEVKWGGESDDYPAFDLYPSLGSDGEVNSFSMIIQSAEGYEIEVIRNIYENPELLRGEK